MADNSNYFSGFERQGMNQKLKAINLSMKNLSYNHQKHNLKRQNFSSMDINRSAQELESRKKILKNTFLNPSVSKEKQMGDSYTASFQHISSNNFVPNLTRIDSLNKKLAIAVNNNKLQNEANCKWIIMVYINLKI